MARNESKDKIANEDIIFNKIVFLAGTRITIGWLCITNALLMAISAYVNCIINPAPIWRAVYNPFIIVALGFWLVGTYLLIFQRKIKIF